MDEAPDDDSTWWNLGRMIGMVEKCVDDVSALILAIQAFHPSEIRAIAPMLGLPVVDNLRELTLLTVITARRLDQEAADKLREWATAWQTNRRETVQTYLKENRLARYQ